MKQTITNYNVQQSYEPMHNHKAFLSLYSKVIILTATKQN